MAWRLIVGGFNLARAKEIIQNAGISSFSVSHNMICFEYTDATLADSVTDQIKQEFPVRLVKDFETLEDLISFVKYTFPYE